MEIPRNLYSMLYFLAELVLKRYPCLLVEIDNLQEHR